MRYISKLSVSCLLLVAGAAACGQAPTIDPTSQIQWNLGTGTGSPGSNGINCTQNGSYATFPYGAQWGQTYTDTTGNVQYYCTRSGWVLGAGTGCGTGGGSVATGCTGATTFTPNQLVISGPTSTSSLTNSGITQTGSGASQIDTFPGTVAATGAVLTQAPITYTSIAPFGDSLTWSFQEESGSTYPQALAVATGKPVLSNNGIPGQTSHQIAVRMNAYAGTVNQQVTVTGGTIPASGGVAVTFPTGYEPGQNAQLTTANCVQIIIQGISGCVNGASTFTRSSAGSATASPANSQWIPDLTGIVIPGSTLEVIEMGENNYTLPSQVYTDVAASVLAAQSRSDPYIVIGLILHDDDFCPTCSAGAVLLTENATLKATYGVNFFDLDAALLANGNPAVPADAILTAIPATPLSMKALYVTGTLTAAITNTTSCPGPWNLTEGSISLYGSAIVMQDNGEVIYLNDLYGNYPPLSCIRGYNGTTATTHANGTAFKATDGLHLANNSNAFAPAKNGIPGYTFMANGVAATAAQAVYSTPSIVLPDTSSTAISNKSGTAAIGFAGGNIVASASYNGCPNCTLGGWGGLNITETAQYGILLQNWKGGQFTSGQYNYYQQSQQLTLVNGGTSGYVSSNWLPTTTTGAGTGMTVNIQASGGVVNNVWVAFNGTGYAAGDKVYPVLAGSSGDAYVTVFRTNGGTNYGSWNMAGDLTPSCAGCASLGVNGNPIAGLVVNDFAGGGAIQISAGTKALIQSGNGYFSVAGGFAGLNGTYPAWGGTGSFRMGNMYVLGQQAGGISFTSFAGSTLTDSGGPTWLMSSTAFTGAVALQGASSPLGFNGSYGTAGYYAQSNGSSTTPSWTNVLAGAYTAVNSLEPSFVANNGYTGESGSIMYLDAVGPNSSTKGTFDFQEVTALNAGGYIDASKSDVNGNWTDYGTRTALGFLPKTIYSAAGTALPTCNTAAKGQETVVSDATTPTYLSTYASGGAVVAPVMCNGTNWVTY